MMPDKTASKAQPQRLTNKGRAHSAERVEIYGNPRTNHPGPSPRRNKRKKSLKQLGMLGRRGSIKGSPDK